MTQVGLALMATSAAGVTWMLVALIRWMVT